MSMNTVDKTKDLFESFTNLNEKSVRKVPFLPEFIIDVKVIIEGIIISSCADEFTSRVINCPKVRQYINAFDLEQIKGHILTYQDMTTQRSSP